MALQAQKRKAKTSDGVNKNVKKKKKPPTSSAGGSTFDFKVFRKELGSSTDSGISLSQFLQLLENNVDSDNNLSAYIEAGGNSGEILRQITEENKKNLMLVTLVFNILRVMIDKIIENLPLQKQEAEETCRYLLNSFISTIEFMLGDQSNPREQIATLHLLTSIVKLNSELGFLVLNQLNFHPRHMSHLVKFKFVKNEENLRTTFIVFILSFFSEGNTSLIKSLIEKQGLLSMVINDLVKDSADVVLKVVNVLSKQIVANGSITKTNKIKVFNSDVIAQIFNLYNWKDRSKEPEETSKAEINDAVDNLLFELCTSHKLGIYFTDPALGTNELHTSQHLWKALESLQAPWNNASAGKLIMKIVLQCPDLHRPIFNIIEESFVPRNSEQWLKTVVYLQEMLTLFSSPSLIAKVIQMNTSQIFTFVKNVCLPMSILVKSSDSLKSIDYAIVNEIILLLHKMLQSVNKYIEVFKENNVLNCDALIKKLQDFLTKHFPNVDYLASIMHSGMSSKILKTIKTDPEVKEESASIVMPTNGEFLLNILDLLLIYDAIIPESFDPISTTLDSKRMFDKVESVNIEHQEKLMLKITQFLLSADKFAFAPEKPLFNEILHRMFTVFLSPNASLSSEAKSILQNILTTTGFFERNIEEIDILLQIIQETGANDENITETFIKIIKEINLNSDVYKLKLDAIDSATSSRDQETCDYNMDDVFESLNAEGHDRNEPIFVLEKASFTEFCLGIMTFSPNDDAEACFYNLKNKYLVNLLHLQENPKKLLSFLNDFQVDDNVKKYISKWIEKPTNVDSKIYGKLTTLFKLSKYLLSNTPPDIKDILENDLSNTSELVVIFNMTLFYMCSLVSLNLLDDAKKENFKLTLTAILNLSLKKFDSKMLYVKLLKKFLSHSVILSDFKPFLKKKTDNDVFVTEMILDVIKMNSELGVDKSCLEYFLLPYKQKILSSFISCIKKCKKNKKGIYFSNVEDVLSVVGLHIPSVPNLIKNIVNLDVACMMSEESEVSSWLKILCFSVDLYTDSEKMISIEEFKKITLFYSKMILDSELTINLTVLEESLVRYLLKNPEHISSVPYSVFESIFNIKHVNKSTVKLASLLLKFNENVLPIFVKIIKNPEMLEKRELVIPLFQAALFHPTFLNESETIQNVYNKYQTYIHKLIEKPHKSAQLYIDNCGVLEFLIDTCMSTVECQKILKKVHKFETAEIFLSKVLESIFLKAVFKEENDDKLTEIQENYVLNILSLSLLALKKETVENALIDQLSRSLEKFLAYSSILCKNEEKKLRLIKTVSENAIWQNFIKSVLKQSLRIETEHKSSNSLFNTLSSLIDFLYSGSHDDINNAFEMIVSHSEFLNVILSTQNPEVKLCLLKLILTLLRKDSSAAKVTHIPIYLSAYHATRSKVDLTILKILNIYESSGISMAEYQPYLWGDIASNHYAVRMKRNRRTLWSNPTANHVLNLLDREMIYKTIKHFSAQHSWETNADSSIINDDVRKTLSDLSLVRNSNKSESSSQSLPKKAKEADHLRILESVKNSDLPIFESDENVESSVYDPCFVLPLLNFIMAPGSLVYTHRIVRGGILAIPLISLSSTCPEVRAAAYTVLHRFYGLLESEMYYKKDKLLWTGFFDTLRSSLNTAVADAVEQGSTILNPRLPAVAAVYLARSVFVMMHPLDPLFKPVNYFVISKMSINFSIIPDFLDLFHNSDIAYSERRIWILKIIRDGVKSFTDVKVLLKSVAFKILLDFYNSCLATEELKVIILEVLNSCILIPKAAKILREGYGLLSWLGYTCRNCNRENKKQVSALVKITSDLWFSFSKPEKNKSTTCNLTQDVHQELCSVLIDLLPKFGSIDSSGLVLYLDTFRKINRKCIQTFNHNQMLTLVDECDKYLKNGKFSSLMKSALKSKKRHFMSSCVLFIDHHEINSDEYKIAKYFHDIATVWLL